MPGRRGFLDLRQRRLHPVDDVERRGVAVLDDRQQHRALALGVHDVLLHGPAVAHMRNVGQIDGGGADLLDRQPVQRVDRIGECVDFDDELLVAQLGVARRQRQALRVDRVQHVVRRDAVCAQRVRVEIDHDLAILAAVRRRQRDTGYRRQRLAHLIDAVVVQLLFVQPVGTEAELQYRYGRRVELHDDGRLDARRHQGADEVGRRDDLADGEIDVDVGLEENLFDRDAGQRLALDVADVADARADRVLAVGGDALLHLLRGQAGVLPDDGDDRDVDRRENVLRRGDDRAAAQEQHEECQHIERVLIAKGEPYDAHDKPPRRSANGACRRRGGRRAASGRQSVGQRHGGFSVVEKVGLADTQTARRRCRSVAVANGCFCTAAYWANMDMFFA